MQSFWDLTDDEVLALPDADVDRYIDLECAAQGVAFVVPEAGPEPQKHGDAMVPHDGMIYVVKMGGDRYISSDKLVFTKLEDAERVLEAIQAATSRCELGYGDGKYQIITQASGSAEGCSIIKQTAYTQGTWDRIKDAVKSFSERMSDWRGKVEARDNAHRARERASSEIRERISEVHAKAAKINDMLSVWRKYVALTLNVPVERVEATADGATAVLDMEGDITRDDPLSLEEGHTAWKYLITAQPEAKDVLPMHAILYRDMPDAIEPGSESCAD